MANDSSRKLVQRVHVTTPAGTSFVTSQADDLDSAARLYPPRDGYKLTMVTGYDVDRDDLSDVDRDALGY